MFHFYCLWCTVLGNASQVHGSAALCSLPFWWPQQLWGVLGQPSLSKAGKLLAPSKGILMLLLSSPC